LARHLARSNRSGDGPSVLRALRNRVASDVSKLSRAFDGAQAPMDPSIALALFIALGMAEGVAPAVTGAVFGVLSKVVGSLYLYCTTNGGVISAAVVGYRITIDMSILIYAIVAGSIIVGVVDASTQACEGASKA